MNDHFLVLVACDLYDQKVNIELGFPVHPSLAELTRATETTFNAEAVVLRKENSEKQNVRVLRFQLYDDRTNRWVELTNATHLSHNCQVYAFQREVDGHMESQKPIPAARRPTGYKGPSTMTSPLQYSTQRTASLSLRRGQDPSPPRASPEGSVRRRPLPDHDHAPFEEKVRVVFGEIDVNHSRSIDVEEWKRCFRQFNINFTLDTITALFCKADVDSNGRISLMEFHRFCEGYPTLIDCLYLRTRDRVKDHQARHEISVLSESLEALRRKAAEARALAEKSQHDVDARERSMGRLDPDVHAREAQEAEARELYHEATRDAERSQKDHGDREHDLSISRDKERVHQLALLEVQRDTERVARRVGQQQTDLLAAQDRERHIASQLAEAQRETERHRAAAHALQMETQSAAERERQGVTRHQEAQREIQRLTEIVTVAEHDIVARLQRVRDAEAVVAEAQRETLRAQSGREESDRELQAHREAERDRVADQMDAHRSMEDTERRLKAMEAELSGVVHRRLVHEQQEKPLLEEEVLLKAMRDELAEKDSRHKLNANTYFDVSRGRALSAVGRLSSPHRTQSPRGSGNPFALNESPRGAALSNLTRWK